MTISKKLKLIEEMERRNSERWKQWGEQVAKATHESAESNGNSESSPGNAS